MMDYNITALRQDPVYILYYLHWTRLITTGILPFVYLLVTNLLIWRTINHQEPNDSAPEAGHQKNVGQKQGLRAHRVSPASTSGFSSCFHLNPWHLPVLFLFSFKSLASPGSLLVFI